MLKDLFCKSLFTIKFILGNKIMVITLTNTCVTKYGFINEKFAEKVCQVLKIKSQYLIKSK